MGSRSGNASPKRKAHQKNGLGFDTDQVFPGGHDVFFTVSHAYTSWARAESCVVEDQ
jgi:hypothetical protein